MKNLCFVFILLFAFSGSAIAQKRSWKRNRGLFRRNNINFVGKKETTLKYSEEGCGANLIEIDLCDFSDGADYIMSEWMKSAIPTHGFCGCFGRGPGYRFYNSCEGETAEEAMRRTRRKGADGRLR